LFYFGKQITAKNVGQHHITNLNYLPITSQLPNTDTKVVPSQTPLMSSSVTSSLSVPAPLPIPVPFASMDTAALYELQFLVQCETKVIHNFSKSGSCKVNVLLSIKNCSVREQSFFFEALQPQETDNSTLQTIYTSPFGKTGYAQFFWSGITYFRVSKLLPNETKDITLTACFIMSGVYNLNHFRVHIDQPSSDPSTPNASILSSPYQHLLTVLNVAE